MKHLPINFKEKFSKFNEQWKPKVIAEMNDYQFKLAKLQGEFVWHNHSNTDEVFIVIKGKMDIKFRDGKVTLAEGEMYVVKKGIDHKPIAKNECHALIIEPRGVINTGEEYSELTTQNDVWI